MYGYMTAVAVDVGRRRTSAHDTHSRNDSLLPELWFWTDRDRRLSAPTSQTRNLSV